MTTQAQPLTAPDFAPTARTRVNRHSERGRYSADEIYPIVDEALVCSVGLIAGGAPLVIPMIHARIGDTLYLHGAPASRLLQQAQSGMPLCVTVTLVDGIIFARAVFKHSLNYRSAVLFGNGRLVDDPDEKMRALEAVTEHIAKGRWADARWPTRKELAATLVVAVDIEAASAKVRTGGPLDDEEDLSLPMWAGFLPLSQTPLAPIADPRATSASPLPDYIAHYQRTI
jgi:nitroimidazol reductase NimA-like FMN-containing flavoprotein (pyridoxamine 5'-phosphate oxidase superfamily)